MVEGRPDEPSTPPAQDRALAVVAAVDRAPEGARTVGEIPAVRPARNASSGGRAAASVHNYRGFVGKSDVERDEQRRANRGRLWDAHRAQCWISTALYHADDPRAEALKRYSFCRRYTRGDVFSVKQRDRRCHLGDVKICGSPWCVMCGTKISEVRALEYAAAALVVIDLGGIIAANSWTFEHALGDDLGELLMLLAAAMKAVDHDKSVKALRERILWHHVRRLDDTWGPINGHHPHRHGINLYVPGTTPEQAQELDDHEFEVFRRFLARRGRKASKVKGHAFEVVETASVAEKLAQYLCRDAAREMAYASTKWGWGENRTMAQILGDFHRTGEMRDCDVWLEYAIAFRGKRAIRASPGLRDELVPDVPALSDEQIAQADDGLGLVLDSFPQSVLDSLWRSRGGPARFLDAAERSIEDGDYDADYLHRSLAKIVGQT